MLNDREYERFDRIGIEKDRCYYIPFDEADEVKYRYGIVDRSSSSRFVSLDGEWLIEAHANLDEVDISEPISRKIDVPSCVQLNGYDRIQYLNARYPFPADPPYVPYDDPCWHYRREFKAEVKAGERYYLDFEGVDSSFYLYVNGIYKGYSQISHATSEFDVTSLLKDGVNVLDVVVLKWCASSYLECQDKFRFSGIFRSVYLLRRPEEHVTDYYFKTTFTGESGSLIFKNESLIDLYVDICGKRAFIEAGKTVSIPVGKVRGWSAEKPYLYTLVISANGEKIYEKVGFREVAIDGKVFKINGEAIKFKGVNRHEFNCKTGATVTLRDMVRDVKLLKYLNVNAVRTSHYPNVPEFYALCDKNGIYVLDEADLETHGAVSIEGGWKIGLWQEYAENMLFEHGIYDRHKSLVERDKNRACVVMWSLGNESSFGKAFYKGAKYIRSRDDRPVHYENLTCAKKKYYYTPLVDVVSMMYPSVEVIKKEVLDNERETRPFVLCEYSHAMGNSCGDLADYWKLIYENEQCAGGFVWEFADHAIRTGKGFLYGGDFGERIHDGNFCCDGLLTADRKLKSSALEMRAVYGGKTENRICHVDVTRHGTHADKVSVAVDEKTGQLISVVRDGEQMLRTPFKINVRRFTDNDRHLLPLWNDAYDLAGCRPHIRRVQKTADGYVFDGVLASDCHRPAVKFTLSYKVNGSKLSVGFDYEVAEYIKKIPRIGFEVGIDRGYADFKWAGFGPYESYADKNMACEYGNFSGNAFTSYDRNYVMPQESGSHYHTEYLSVEGAFSLTAKTPFSFSLNPYTTDQLISAKHSFELKENDFIDLCVDLFMRGVGSHSCGPELDEKYECEKSGSNEFVFDFYGRS